MFNTWYFQKANCSRCSSNDDHDHVREASKNNFKLKESNIPHVFCISRFPWESAYTGIEVTQPCCPDVATYEQHISGCISFAIRQYLATTRDEEWLKVRTLFSLNESMSQDITAHNLGPIYIKNTFCSVVLGNWD